MSVISLLFGVLVSRKDGTTLTGFASGLSVAISSIHGFKFQFLADFPYFERYKNFREELIVYFP
jgi:hypothetical protein